MLLDSISLPGKFNFLAWGTFQTEPIPFVVNSLVFPICFRGVSVVLLWCFCGFNFTVAIQEFIAIRGQVLAI